MIQEIRASQLDAARFIEDKVRDIRAAVGEGTAINALSGGVDSSTVTLLGHRALGERLRTVFVEKGLMRAGEAERVRSLFRGLGVQCIDEFGGLVWAIARRMTRSRADAEDAVQEMFTDVWRSAHRYDASAGTEKVFVTTIARRRLIDRMRRLSNRVPTESTDVLDELGFHTPDTAGEISVEAERAARVLATLRPEQRQVIELGLLHGLSHSEIAAATGMPLGTVKTFMRRGLIQVREMLGVTPGEAGEGEA